MCVVPARGAQIDHTHARHVHTYIHTYYVHLTYLLGNACDDILGFVLPLFSLEHLQRHTLVRLVVTHPSYPVCKRMWCVHY